MNKLGNLSVNKLGFGAMRLPLDENGEIDEKILNALVECAVSSGINYFDCAYNYLGGKCEKAVGKALSIYRDKIFLATKAPWWLFNCPSDFDKYLNIQLSRLKTDHLDVYLLHAMTLEAWTLVKKLGIVEKLAAAKRDGRVKNVGFSFHDGLPLFKEIIDYAPSLWDVCQIQLNYLDEGFQAGLEGAKYAKSKGLDVIIMEPLRGGRLVSPPKEAAAVLDKLNKPYIESAFDYLFAKEEISLVLSGMRSVNEITENVGYAKRAPKALTEVEKEIYREAAKEFTKYDFIACTGCSYCLPCPKDVNIPYCFICYNNYKRSGDLASAEKLYSSWRLLENKYASNCVKCGLCESKCPQHLDIRKHLSEVKAAFGK